MLRRFLDWLFGKREPVVIKIEVNIDVKEITIKSNQFEESRRESNSSTGSISKAGSLQSSDEQAIARFQERIGGAEKKQRLGMPEVKFGEETG